MMGAARGGRPLRRAPAILLIMAVLGGAAYLAFRLLTFSLDQARGFSPSYHRSPAPTAGTPSLSPRLFLLLVDSLSPTDTIRMPSLHWLQRQGATWRMRVQPPVREAPLLATLLTGMPPHMHGVYPMGVLRPLAPDNLLHAGRRREIGTAAVGSEALLAQTIPWLNRGAYLLTGESDFGQATDRIRQLLTAGGPELIVVSLPPLRGGNRDEALAALDARIAQFTDLLDLQAMTVIVAGVRPPERHSGWVPLIAAGAGIRPGHFGTATPRDVAPTAAVLLGLPVPGQSVGTPLWDGLTLSAGLYRLKWDQVAQTRLAHAGAFTATAGYDASLPPLPEQPDETVWAAAASAEKAAARHAWQSAFMQRAPYVGGAFLASLLVMVIILATQLAAPLLLGSLFYVTLAGLLFVGGGGLSAPWLEDLFRDREVARVAISALATAAATAVVTGLLLSRRGIASKSYLTLLSMSGSLLTLSWLGILVSVLFVLHGWEFPLVLPGDGWLATYSLALIHAIILGAGAPAWTLLTAGAGRLAARVAPRAVVPDPPAPRQPPVRPIRRPGR
jgi:hypothetical protein